MTAEALEQRLAGDLGYAKRVCNRQQYEIGIRDGRERHEEDAVSEMLDEPRCQLNGKARLAGAPRTGEREQTHILVGEKPAELSKFGLASYERCHLCRQIRVVQCPQRRELGLKPLRDQLEEPLGVRKVLQPMLAEVANLDLGVEEFARGSREQHLAAVARGADAGSAMDVDADVAFCGDGRSARVDAHPDVHRCRGERALRVVSGGHSIGCAGERYEEGVALGVDLDPVVGGERGPKESSLCRQLFGIPLAKLTKKPGRALYVREEQRDRARR